jgi:hypothetical protein
VGKDWEGRDLADDATGMLRDHAPDPLAPIDASSPISGHNAPRPAGSPASAAPEHDWGAARDAVYPILRPTDSHGQPLDVPIDPTTAGTQVHTQPLVSPGPCGLFVGYALAAAGFDVLVNVEHLLSWAIPGEELAATAGQNLARWSAGATWTDETSGERRLLSSDTGEGYDAARILLPEVREHLTRELGSAAPGTRVLVGLPERHLLVAGALAPGDPDFAALFRDFVVEHSGGADEPLDRRVFELTEGQLVEFAG